MANRSFHPHQGSLEVNVVSLYGFFTVGSTGACTIGTTGNKGIASVTRNSAGKYTIALSDTYSAFLWADAIVLDTANSDPVSVGVVPRLFSTAVTSTTAPAFVIQFYDVAGGEVADPASGATVYFKVEVRNSTLS